MGDGVVGADIDIERFPILNFFWIPGGGLFGRGGIAPEVPRGASVAVEGIGFAGHFLDFSGFFVKNFNF